MIAIDRASSIPVHEQVVEQVRYLIASGHFQVDDLLPSTRMLAEQIGVSFHTVRKAYQRLEDEGLLAAHVGKGFRVRERTVLSKGERIERGAAIVQEALLKLIGLGLQEAEVEYLFQEQFDALAGARPGSKLLFAAPYREMAELCAEQLSLALQQPVEPATLDDLIRHQDADYVVARFADLRVVMEHLPRADAFGVVTYLLPEALERVARLLAHQTLGIVTRYADAIQPLMTDLRAQTGFSGQILAVSIDESTLHLTPFTDQADLIVFTPSCRRRLLPLLPETQKSCQIAPVVNHVSVDHLRRAVPG